MENNGRWIDLEEIENLLRWQYSHLVELDDFLMSHVQGYKTIFIKDQAWYDKTFIGWTITRFNWFRNSIGRELIFQNKPTSDLIGEIDAHTKWLTNFKKKRKPLSEKNESTAELYIGLHTRSLIFVLEYVNNFIADREFSYIQNLESSLSKKEVKKKLLELASEKIKVTQPCRLRSQLREKEQSLYELLAQHLATDESINNPKASESERKRLTAVQFTIYNTGNNNVTNTGDHAFIRATINQNNIAGPESLKAEIKQLAEQIKELLHKVASIESDTKHEIFHQIEAVERQVTKEKPNFSLVGKALQIVESLLLDAATSETTPLILTAIKHLLPQLIN